jgi:signal transduction histidine kinase
MSFRWQTICQVPKLLSVPTPDIEQQVARIRHVERNIILPVKGIFIALVAYYLFLANWFDPMPLSADFVTDVLPGEVTMEVVRRFFFIYLAFSAGVASLLFWMQHLPAHWIPRIVLISAWVDGLFLSALLMVTGGAESALFWAFLALIVRNGVSIGDAGAQLTSNFVLTLCYVAAGLLEAIVTEWEVSMMHETTAMAIQQFPPDTSAESFLLRISLLLLMTICSFGVQILMEKQRLAEGEAREFALRQQQLEATGRLAAEIAHQLKNPLGIINTAAFTLQRTVKEGKTITQQIKMIREEVERSDRILTELMGYAQLSEGRVEKLDVARELDHAIDQVFPAAAKYEVAIHRQYAPALPQLLLQKNHLREVLVNVLQNSREAMDGKGTIHVSASYGEKYSVVITIRDDGPGIAPDNLPRIFEPYFTTREKGSGLGLAIVRHNTEMYGGTVQVESELGSGARFTLTFPARTMMKIRK